MKKGSACGHEDCGVSSGICEELTFGRGEQPDYHGYWEIPCLIVDDAVVIAWVVDASQTKLAVRPANERVHIPIHVLFSLPSNSRTAATASPASAVASTTSHPNDAQRALEPSDSFTPRRQSTTRRLL